ncbi:MAG TPA: ribonuclease D [Alphaproteobacteria bacterium]|nr:ribonuclease D [Alphaproteobacteria bacterium]
MNTSENFPMPADTEYHEIDGLKIYLHHDDLPAEVYISFKGPVAVDCEMNRNLDHKKGKLCLAQFKAANSDINHLVKFNVDKKNNAPVLVHLLENPNYEKIFHFGRVDLAFLGYKLGATPRNIFCTRIASKMIRRDKIYAEDHSLKPLLKEYLGVEISKEEQCSMWENEVLTENQLKYAALDVEYLHDLKARLLPIAMMEKIDDLLYENCHFLETQIKNDLLGLPEDLFSYGTRRPKN